MEQHGNVYQRLSGRNGLAVIVSARHAPHPHCHVKGGGDLNEQCISYSSVGRIIDEVQEESARKTKEQEFSERCTVHFDQPNKSSCKVTGKLSIGWIQLKIMYSDKPQQKFSSGGSINYGRHPPHIQQKIYRMNFGFLIFLCFIMEKGVGGGANSQGFQGYIFFMDQL